MRPVTLFPRLSRLGTISLLANGKLIGKSLVERIKIAEPFICYASSGGSRVTIAELQKMRNSILDIAHLHGFPNTGSQSDKSNFDAACAIWFAELTPIPDGEAHRDDVWSCITTCIFPDIVAWRYGNVTERYHGGVRNTFQRLWMRGRALDRGQGEPLRWNLVHSLSEDAVVQIIERPSVAANSRLALAIGEAWVNTSKAIGVRRMEGVTRQAVRNIRIANEVLYLACLEDEALRSAVDIHFRAAASISNPAETESDFS